MRDFEDIGSKGHFSAKNHIMSPQAMYFWPKNGQNGQNKNFPRHNTAIKWFKATVPSFWLSFRQIWCANLKKMSKNLIFGLKMAKYGKNWPFLAKILKREFFSKIRLEHFLASSRCNFVPSFRKIWCADLQISRHARTHARTHERESIGPLANAERPKKWRFWKNA